MKIQVGQWYQCRDTELRAHVVGGVFDDKYSFAVILYRNGKYFDCCALCHDGQFMHDPPEEHAYDFVKHLPECTGPGWKPARWRPATVDDLKRSMAAARFRDNDVQEWRHSHLCGARWVGQVIHWQDAGLNCWWLRCEILDEQS